MTTTTTRDRKPIGRRGQTPASAPTWDQLTAREPLLAELLEEIRRVRAGRNFCANEVWFGYHEPEGGYKEAMSQLVGWDRKGHPVLGTMAAFDVAYDVLYGALPNCRHPGPFC